MDPEFWLERWEENNIGFHLDEVNPYLQRYVHRLAEPGSSVFVPLCGKTLDIPWLSAQGYPTVGIELSPVAVEAMFVQAGYAYDPEVLGAHRICSHGDVRIFIGDFFTLPPSSLGRIEAVYDRAALIALPREMRPRYVNRLLGELGRPVRTLLITVEYDQSQMSGPPHSVGEEEIFAHFADTHTIERLETNDVLEREQRFKQRGLTALDESVYLLTPSA